VQFEYQLRQAIYLYIYCHHYWILYSDNRSTLLHVDDTDYLYRRHTALDCRIGRRTKCGRYQAWIPLGSFRLQPSEFGKLATCLLLAYYLNSQANKTPNLKTLFIGACIVLLPVFLVMLQPDTGSALAFFSLIFVFYREGYVSTTFLSLIALAIFLFVMALLVPSQWVLIGGLVVVFGLAAFMLR